MSAAHVPALCGSVVFYLLIAACAATETQTHPTKQDGLGPQKIEIFDGVTVKIPHETNNTDKMFSFEIDTSKSVEQGRGKQKKLMERILPMFILPFLIQSTIVPFFLSTLKFMLMKSLMVGKLALLLIIINAFKNHNTFKGRHDAQMADTHYGYHGNGMEEYGAYVN